MDWQRVAEQMRRHEFDVPFELADGVLVPRLDVYGPESVEHDAQHDTLVDGVPYAEHDQWRALTGYTGQYGYHGPMLHPSEVPSAGMAEGMFGDPEEWEEAGSGVYVMCPDSEGHGWYVLQWKGQA